MENHTIEKLIQAVRDDNLYDYIANNYCEMTKEELAVVIKEYDYILYYESRASINGDIIITRKELMEKLADELHERYFEEV